MTEQDYVATLKVEVDGSGRRTLTVLQAPETYAPLDGHLRDNDDAGTFYRAVAARLALFAATGMKFTYEDAGA
ncbi:hypothetical protein [uncultured Sphingomonas sp.]|uniref:hypothetical protein n=1 Tax=uncultured Sphingomonas sp. TaxID=158754 RepID=UPI00263928BD|nr:hypothetical protein [uncultured Sphingomonas sp.]